MQERRLLLVRLIKFVSVPERAAAVAGMKGEEGLRALEEAKCTSTALRRSGDLSFSDLSSARE